MDLGLRRFRASAWLGRSPSHKIRFQRELRQVEAASAQRLSLSEEQGFAYACDLDCGLIGWARAQLGRTVEGISLIRQALAGIEKSGASRTDANPREREWRSDRTIGSGRIVGGFYP